MTVKKQKFYAVRLGRRRGVFTTWEECKEQVFGYAGAVFKSFASAEEAHQFLGNRNCGGAIGAVSDGGLSVLKDSQLPGKQLLQTDEVKQQHSLAHPTEAAPIDKCLTAKQKASGALRRSQEQSLSQHGKRCRYDLSSPSREVQTPTTSTCMVEVYTVALSLEETIRNAKPGRLAVATILSQLMPQPEDKRPTSHNNQSDALQEHSTPVWSCCQTDESTEESNHILAGIQAGITAALAFGFKSVHITSKAIFTKEAETRSAHNGRMCLTADVLSCLETFAHDKPKAKVKTPGSCLAYSIAVASLRLFQAYKILPDGKGLHESLGRRLLVEHMLKRGVGPSTLQFAQVLGENKAEEKEKELSAPLKEQSSAGSREQPFPSPTLKECLLQFDGGARGNPGPAGAGAVLLEKRSDGTRNCVAEVYLWLDKTTNNVAEYTALIQGLRLASRMGYKSVAAEGDSSLVVNQVNGDWKVTKAHVKALHIEAMEEVKRFNSFTIRYIPRAENSVADSLANRAMDMRMSQEMIHSG